MLRKIPERRTRTPLNMAALSLLRLGAPAGFGTGESRSRLDLKVEKH